MGDLTRAFFSLSLLVLIVFGVLLIPSLSDNARAQSCDIAICKIAEGAGDLFFQFEANQGGDIHRFRLVDGGLCVLLDFNAGSDFDVSENAVPGWVLDNVDCETSGITVTKFDSGVTLNCVGENGSSGQCNFINVPGVNANVPTLSEWGMIAAAAGLGLIGVFFAVRRRRAQDA